MTKRSITCKMTGILTGSLPALAWGNQDPFNMDEKNFVENYKYSTLNDFNRLIREKKVEVTHRSEDGNELDCIFFY